MIYETVSIDHVYSRISLTLNLDDDNEYLNIYEFIGWAIREIGAHGTLEMVTKQLTIADHRVELPCDFFRLRQICYNGWPLTWSSRTFKYQYLLCEECVNDRSSVFEADTVVRYNTNLDNIIADYTSTDGIQVININMIVKVAPGHTAGGIIGNYYKRSGFTLAATDLSTIDYSGVNWTNVSTDVGELNAGGLSTPTSSPYLYTYQINPGYIMTNFESGTVDMSYDAIPTDSKGYYKVPDDEMYLWALEYYVKVRMIQRGYKFPEEDLRTCKAEWMKYRDMARSNAQMWNIDQTDVFTKRWMRPLAVLDRAQNFFNNEF